VIDRIEHDHSLGNTRGVIAKLATSRIPAPDFENGCFQSVKKLNG
jgi:hypothetical protein